MVMEMMRVGYLRSCCGLYDLMILSTNLFFAVTYIVIIPVMAVNVSLVRTASDDVAKAGYMVSCVIAQYDSLTLLA